MRVQFLTDMLIGWVIYTKEGKEAANRLLNEATKLLKDNLKSNNIKLPFVEKKEKKTKPTMEDKY